MNIVNDQQFANMAKFFASLYPGVELDPMAAMFLAPKDSPRGRVIYIPASFPGTRRVALPAECLFGEVSEDRAESFRKEAALRMEVAQLLNRIDQLNDKLKALEIFGS